MGREPKGDTEACRETWEQNRKEMVSLQGEDYHVCGVWKIVICGLSKSVTRGCANVVQSVSNAWREKILWNERKHWKKLQDLQANRRVICTKTNIFFSSLLIFGCYDCQWNCLSLNDAFYRMFCLCETIDKTSMQRHLLQCIWSKTKALNKLWHSALEALCATPGSLRPRPYYVMLYQTGCCISRPLDATGSNVMGYCAACTRHWPRCLECSVWLSRKGASYDKLLGFSCLVSEH